MEEINKRKQHIIDSAILTLKELPIDQVSVRKIAKKAGLTTGAIYHFYNSKDDLIFDCMQQSLYFTSNLYRRVEEGKYQLKGKDLLDEINRQVEQRIRKIEEQKLHIQIISDVIKKDDDLKKEYVKNYRRMIDVVSKLFSEAFTIEESICQKSVASILIAAIDGIALQQALDVLPENIDSIIKTYINFFNESIPEYLKKHSECCSND
ncbi:MAG: TetR family transcriptional regulator [Candidatus Izemoplasmatales bacterium]|nr:TetR family transcriptional regulator [Candidatus Izemoplasmatales bacterium]